MRTLSGLLCLPALAALTAGCSLLEPTEKDNSAALAAAVAAAAGGSASASTVGSFSIASTATVVEGDAGSQTVSITVTRSGGTAAGTVSYATADGTTNPATTADSDYASASGSLSFAAGETSKTISVQVNGDGTTETHQTFKVTISNASGGGTISTSTCTVTILNNDGGAPTFAITGVVAVTEGNGGGVTNFVFTVTLSVTQGTASTVDYTSANGTAVAGASCVGGADYIALTTSTLTIPANTGTGTITAQVCADSTSEATESFTITLTNPSVGSIAGGESTGTGSIVTDD